MVFCKDGSFRTTVVIDLHSTSTAIKEVKKILTSDKTLNFPYELSLGLDKNGRSLGLVLIQVPLSKANLFTKFHERSINGKKISVLISSPGLRVWRSVKKVHHYGKKDFVSSADCLPLNIKPALTVGVLVDVAGDLTGGELRKDVDSVILSAYHAGVKWINIPGQSFNQCHQARELVEIYKDVYPLYFSVGIHPKYYNTWKDTEESINALEELLKHPQCRSVGIIGLDYQKDSLRTNSSKEAQKNMFEAQLQLACTHRKPVFLVQNAAHDDFLKIMYKYRDKLPRCALLDVSIIEDTEHIKEYAQLGLYFVLTGLSNGSSIYTHRPITDGITQGIIPATHVLLSSYRTTALKIGIQDNDRSLNLKVIADPRYIQRSSPELIGDLIKDICTQQNICDNDFLQNCEDFLFASHIDKEEYIGGSVTACVEQENVEDSLACGGVKDDSESLACGGVMKESESLACGGVMKESESLACCGVMDDSECLACGVKDDSERNVSVCSDVEDDSEGIACSNANDDTETPNGDVNNNVGGLACNAVNDYKKALACIFR